MCGISSLIDMRWPFRDIHGYSFALYSNVSAAVPFKARLLQAHQQLVFTHAIAAWIIKTDPAGNQQWDRTIFLNDGASTSNAFQTSDGSYIIGSFTGAEIGYYKTQPSWDSSSDYWIVKFRDTVITGINEITNKMQMSLYPNPFTSELDISIAQPNLKQADFSICNVPGQTIYTQHETNVSLTYTKILDLSYLPDGVYLVEVVVDGEVR
jgi:hypothetical protein